MMRLVRPRSSLGVLICLILVSSTLFVPTLKSLDDQSHASLGISSIIPASCSSNCPPQQPPLMIGFGGLRLDSATITATACAVCYKNTTFVASNVFPGQSQSDTERLLVRMKAMGFNAIKVSFAPFCSNPAGDPSDSPYNLTDAQNTVKVASYYGFWIVLRYDGNDDISTQTTCWLNYWQGVIQQMGPLYGQLIWDPVNEPSAAVSVTSTDYQLWINMARSVGDTHFIVVENQCSGSGCTFSLANTYLGYPTVTDPAGKVLISYHKYYHYSPNDVWTVSAAISTAQADVATTLKGMQVTGWSAFDTEGGPALGVSTCNGPSGTTSGCPPGTVLPGAASYANLTLAYIQTLTSLFDSHSPRIGWVWWPIGTWVDTECAGSYGALQPVYCPGGVNYSGGVGWGNRLHYAPVNGTSPQQPPPPPPSTQPPNNQPGSGGICLVCSFKPLLPMLFILTIGIASGLLAVAGLFFARSRSREKRKTVLERTSL
jgi:hypothetical protein